MPILRLIIGLHQLKEDKIIYDYNVCCVDEEKVDVNIRPILSIEKINFKIEINNDLH